MSDQPTWDGIRDVWVDSRARNDTEVEEHQAAFDRARAAHDAQVLRDAADRWHTENTGTAPRMYSWLLAEADRIAGGASHG